MLNSDSGRPSLNPPVDRTFDGGGAAASLEKHLCQVVGLNQNYSSAAGTLYHIQVEADHLAQFRSAPRLPGALMRADTFADEGNIGDGLVDVKQ